MNNFEYNKEVLKRFRKPKFAGEIKNADGIGQVGNSQCGDIMRVFLKIEKNKKTGQEKIKDIKFKTMGCVAAIASSDAVCEIAKGKTLKDALKITRKDIIKKVGNLPQIKHHCSILGEEALVAAIKDYESKRIMVHKT
jgi:nitrogen fixation NifU-like protein